MLIYLISILTSQILIYIGLLLPWKRRVPRSAIVGIAVLLFSIGPWLMPVEGGGYDPETDEYVCGLASVIPMMLFWVVGLGGSVMLYLLFSAIGWFRQRPLE